jgi:hypothetical protein
MKSILVVAAITVSFLSGCSDEVSNNPVKSPQSFLKSPDGGNVILINSDVKDPAGFGNAIHVEGSVSYKVRDYIEDLAKKALPTVDVSIFTRALLTPIDGELTATSIECGWEAGGSSTDRVFLTQIDYGTLVKSYLINGRTDGARLLITFRVSKKGLEMQDLRVVVKRTPPLDDTK